jgi:mannitol/fructose-specific phosphotransferase system IIA component (Ntr-type)
MSPTIDDITNANLVALDLGATDRWGAIDALAGLIEADGRLTDKESYVQVVRAREEEQVVRAREEDTGGTAIEMGIAIPHAKSPGVKSAGVAFGRTREPIDFGDEKADLVFLIAAPEGEHNLHVTVLSQLTRRLVHEKFRTALRQAGTTEEVVDLMRQEVKISK